MPQPAEIVQFPSDFAEQRGRTMGWPPATEGRDGWSFSPPEQDYR